MKPYDVNTIADYINLRLNTDEETNLINLKLQKLVYYVQAWSLGINKEPLINCDFEAWAHGPVSRELYNRFRDTKTLYSYITLKDIQNRNVAEVISKDDKEFIDYILDNYAGFPGFELESMTHKELPWIKARHGLDEFASCSEKITEESMLQYYGEKWNQLQE